MRTGDRLGRYQLRGILGAGGMGQVWRAFDPQLGRDVALKVLRTAASSEKQNERFRREALSLAKVRHRNLIRLYEAGAVDTVRFFTMELVEGTTLQARIEASPLSPAHALDVVLQLAEALRAMHAVGVLHRDVKPANVLLTADGVPILTDFGLSLEASDPRLTVSGTFVGTAGYLAPELASGRAAALDPRGDVFALGAVLYACLTGGPPHGTFSLVQQLVAAEHLPPPPSRFAAGVSGHLDSVCLRCLAPRPEDRYPDMDSLATELRRSPPAHRGRGLSTVAVGAAALALLGCVVAGFGLLRSEPARDSRRPAPRDARVTPPRLQPTTRELTTFEQEFATREQATAHVEGLLAEDDYEAAKPGLSYLVETAPDRESRRREGVRLVRALAAGGPLELDRARKLLKTLQEEAELETTIVDATAAQLFLHANAALFIGLGEVELRVARGEHEAALEVARRLNVEHPHQPRASVRLAELLLAAKRYEEIVEWLRPQIEDVDGALARREPLLRALHSALRRLKRYDERDEVSRELCNCSIWSYAYHDLRRSRERGPYEAALQRYTELPANADTRLVRMRLGYLLELDGYKEPMRLAKRLLKEDPGCVAAHVVRAEVWLLRSDFSEALGAAEGALKAAPHVAELHVLRARALSGLRRHREAIAAAQRAQALDPVIVDRSCVLVVEATDSRELGLPNLEAIYARMEASREPYVRTVGRLFRRWDRPR